MSFEEKTGKDNADQLEAGQECGKKNLKTTNSKETT